MEIGWHSDQPVRPNRVLSELVRFKYNGCDSPACSAGTCFWHSYDDDWYSEQSQQLKALLFLLPMEKTTSRHKRSSIFRRSLRNIDPADSRFVPAFLKVPCNLLSLEPDYHRRTQIRDLTSSVISAASGTLTITSPSSTPPSFAYAA